MKDSCDQAESSYTFVEHTADISLLVKAKTQEGVFTASARGMMEYIFGSDALQLPATQYQSVATESSDLNSLLVDWLSALHTCSNTDYMISVSYEIESLSDTKIVAKVGWAKAQAHEDIKAVTYSALEIKRVDQHYEACITFDI